MLPDSLQAGGDPAAPPLAVAPEPRDRPSTAGRRRLIARSRASVRAYLPSAAASAAMLGMAVWGLGRGSAMSNDETATGWAASLPVGQLRHLLSHLDAVHGSYYLLMHAWIRTVGSTPTIMRVPSMLAMAGAAAAVAVLGRRLTGSAFVGLLAGLLMAVTPSISFYAQTARSYALVYLVAAVMTLVLLRALDAEASATEEGRARAVRRWIAYGALTTAIGYLNELGLLLLLAHATTMSVIRPGRRALTRWAAAAAVGAALVAPLIVLSNTQSGVLDGLPRPSWRTVGDAFESYFGSHVIVAVLLAACAGYAVLPKRSAAAAPAARRMPTLANVAVPVLLIPATALLVASFVRPLYTNRYVLYGELGAALLAAAGIERLVRRLGPAVRPGLRAAVGVLACGAVLAAQLTVQADIRTPNSRRFNLGGAAQYVHAHARPGDAVLFLTGFYRKTELGYPQYFRALSDIALAESPAEVGDFRGLTKPFAEVRPVMLDHQRIWVVGNPAGVPLGPGAGLREHDLLVARYTVLDHTSFHGVDVTLWSRVGPRPTG